jgi:hypothetical protein
MHHFTQYNENELICLSKFVKETLSIRYVLSTATVVYFDLKLTELSG